MTEQDSNHRASYFAHRVLEFLSQCSEEKKSSPTVREIQEALKIGCRETVQRAIDNLEKWGWITSEKLDKDNKKRRRTGTIQITPSGREQLVSTKSNGQNKKRDVKFLVLSARTTQQKTMRTLNIPISGVVYASFGNEVNVSDPSISSFDPENYLMINEDMFPMQWNTSDLFALRVCGNSMIDAGIESEDYVILKRTQTAENGDMCAFLINGCEPTLKYFHRNGNNVRLDPANSKIQSMQVDESSDIEVQGKVILVVRV